MLAHLTTLSKTFQTGELNFSRINHAIERALFNVKEVDANKHHQRASKKIYLQGCLYVRKIYQSQRRWKLTEKPTDMLNL